MKVITMAALKGGSTKTATTCLLAVTAMQAGHRVCMFDFNPDQANLTQWWICRGKPTNPYLEQDIQHITQDVRVLRASGRFDVLLIDTPPSNVDVMENCVAVSDAVVVPVRTAAFDINSIDAVVETCNHYRRPFQFLLSAVDPKFKALTASAHKALLEDGTVFSTRVSYRLPYINALTAGKVGSEIDKDLLAEEAEPLWIEVQKLADKDPLRLRKPGRQYGRIS
jgi:chromosome partitioning protein